MCLVYASLFSSLCVCDGIRLLGDKFVCGQYIPIYGWMSMLPCGSSFPLVFITTYWAKEDPAVLIKIKGRREWEEEEEDVGEMCEKMEG